MTYIVENNGVYGLTKGQFSATADQGSKSKKGVVNTDTAIDLVAMALQLGASYVARSFSGDKEQLVPLIKGALRHRGAALHRRHQPVRRLQQPRRQHQELRLRARAQRGGEPASTSCRTATRSRAEYAPGEVIEVTQHDGSVLRLRKLAAGYDAGDRLAAMSHIAAHEARGEILTGLLYVDAARRGPARPSEYRRRAAQSPRRERRSAPGSAALDAINAELV